MQRIWTKYVCKHTQECPQTASFAINFPQLKPEQKTGITYKAQSTVAQISGRECLEATRATEESRASSSRVFALMCASTTHLLSERLLRRLKPHWSCT